MITVVLIRTSSTNFGYSFNTDGQEFVEMAMLKLHYSSDKYYLCQTENRPEGIYTNVFLTIDEFKGVTKIEIHI